MRRDRYGTAREILGEIEQLHRDLSAYYTRLGETVSDERLRMMLDYLVQREEEQAEMIFQTLDDREHDAALNTWETSAESVSAEEVLKEVTAGADVSSVEGLTAVARRVDQRLVDYFELWYASRAWRSCSGSSRTFMTISASSASKCKPPWDGFRISDTAAQRAAVVARSLGAALRLANAAHGSSRCCCVAGQMKSQTSLPCSPVRSALLCSVIATVTTDAASR